MDFEAPIPGWVVWDAMGHHRVVGYAVEGEIAGTKVIQIGIPGVERGTFAARHTVSPANIYSVTAIDENRARQMNGLDRPEVLIPTWAQGDDDVGDDDYGGQQDADDQPPF